MLRVTCRLLALNYNTRVCFIRPKINTKSTHDVLLGRNLISSRYIMTYHQSQWMVEGETLFGMTTLWVIVVL